MTFLLGIVCLAMLYPLGIVEMLIKLSQVIVIRYNRCKAGYRQQVIQRNGSARWQQMVELASEIAQQNGFQPEEVRQVLFSRKTELVEWYGTQSVRQHQPELFEELDARFNDWL